jgi:hypothetical protein
MLRSPGAIPMRIPDSERLSIQQRLREPLPGAHRWPLKVGEGRGKVMKFMKWSGLLAGALMVRYPLAFQPFLRIIPS